MTKDEVLKQAYEALVPLSNAGSPQEREILTDDDQVAAYKAMKAIEKAFAQTEQEPAWYHAECDDPDRSGFFKEASDAATQVNDHGGHVTPLYTTPPQHKPLTEQLSKITED